MARVNGNQDVDGHERRTSTSIIRIIDRINFMINNGWGPFSVYFVPRDKVMVTLWLWMHYSCLSLILFDEHL
jgi:hypothetical protein